jgi:hypothetical protein
MTAFSPARILADMLLDKKAVWSMFRRRSDLVRENRDRREPMTTTVSCSSMARYRCTRCGVCIVHARPDCPGGHDFPKPTCIWYAEGHWPPIPPPPPPCPREGAAR